MWLFSTDKVAATDFAGCPRTCGTAGELRDCRVGNHCWDRRREMTAAALAVPGDVGWWHGTSAPVFIIWAGALTLWIRVSARKAPLSAVASTGLRAGR
jgi:hypothetical protein